MYNTDLRMAGYISVEQGVTSLLSKFFIIGGFAILITTSTVSAQTAKVNLQKDIVIPVADMRLDTLLSIISKQAGIRFSVNTGRFPTSRTVHVRKGRQSLLSLLTGLREHTGIGYRVLESHIILVDAPSPVITKKVVAVVVPAKVIPPARFVVTPIAMLSIKKAAPVLVDPVLINKFPALEIRNRDTATFSASVTKRDSVIERSAGLHFGPGITGGNKDTIAVKQSIISSSHKSFASTLLEKLRSKEDNTPVANGVKKGNGFSFQPYASPGMVADESFYVNPTIQAGLPFLYVIGSWSTNFSFSMLRYGAGTSVRLSDDWRLHLQGTTGRLQASSYDTIELSSKVIKAKLHKLSLVAEKQLNNHWRLQFGAVLNSLQTTYYAGGQPKPLNREESAALANVKYFKPPYTIRNTFSPESSSNNKLWIGFQIGLFYRINFFKE